MSFFTFDDIKIAGMTTAVPRNIVKVDDFTETFGKDTVDKFIDMVGVKQYRKCAAKQTASDLGFAAAENLFKELDFDRSKIGVLVFVSLAPDYIRPATACVLQHRLKLSNDCAAFDVGMGCSGFVYGLQIASSMLRGSDADWALLICSENLNRYTYPKDQSTTMLLADAGSAILLNKRENNKINGLLTTDGSLFSAAIVPAGGTRNPDVPREAFVTKDGIERTNYHYLMNGLDIFSFSMSDVPKAFDTFFKRTGTCVGDYDSVVLHQANRMIINRIARKIKAEKSQVPVAIDRYGNTSSVAIPLTICDAYSGENGSAKVIACGFGTGLSLGITSFDIDLAEVFPIIETDEQFEDGLIVYE